MPLIRCTAGTDFCVSHSGGATTHMLSSSTVPFMLIALTFVEKRSCVNGACGQCSQNAREKATRASQPVGYKTWPCLRLICAAGLNIWWCTIFFFLWPISLFKQHSVIGQPVITMTDGFPGGCSAVASPSPRTEPVGLSGVQRACSVCVGDTGWGSTHLPSPPLSGSDCS